MPAISGAPQAPNFAAPGNPSGLAPPASDPWQGQPYNGAAGEGAAPGLELIPRNADGDLFWGEKIRFLQGPRVRYTWLGGGGSSSSVGINDIDASVVFAIPNFLRRGQPFYVAPSFGLHLWDGPFPPIRVICRAKRIVRIWTQAGDLIRRGPGRRSWEPGLVCLRISTR